MDALYTQSGLSELENEFNISIRRRGNSDHRVFYGPDEVFGQAPVMVTIELSGVDWELAAVPHNGWPTGSDNMFEFRILLLLAGLAILLPLVYLLRTFRRLQRAEARVSAEKRRFMTSLESTPNVAVQWYDKQGRVLYWNRASEQMFGWKSQEVMGKMLDHSILSSEQAEDFLSEIKELSLQDREPLVSDYQVQHKDGSARHVHSSLFAIQDEQEDKVFVCMDVDVTERNQVEIELRESRKRYQQLINDLGDRYCVYSHHPETHELLFLSDGFEGLTGIAQDVALGRSWAEVIDFTPDSIEKAVNGVESLVSKQIEMTNLEMDFTHPDGMLHTLYVSSHAVWTESGDIVSIDGIATDITEQKRTLKALESSEEKMRGLFELSPIGIALTDMNGSFIEFNDAFVRICGYPEDELKTLGYWSLTLECYAEDEQRQLESLKRTGYYGPYEKEYVQKDGTIIPVQLNGMLVHDHDGKANIWSIVENISDRKQQENMLRLAATAFDTQEAITITDVQGRIISVNKAFEEVTGYSPKEVIGKRPNVLSSGKHDVYFYEKMWKELIATGRWKGEMINRRKNGELYPEQLSITASKDEHGNTQNYIGVFSDISEKKRIEKQLRQAQKMDAIGTLVSGVAHEFNNMLTGISGNIFLAKDLLEPSSEAYNRLDSAEEVSFRAAKIIEQLLTFARKDSAAHDIESINMVEWLPEGIKLSASALPEKVRLEWNTGKADELTVSGNTTQLQQVVMNLINNAKDASIHKEEPLIRLELSSGKASPSFRSMHKEFKGYEYVCLTVSDNGTGIAADKIDKIFEPFYTTKDIGKGTGLGMSMVQGIVHSHHGCIEVESEVGAGTTFYIYLPRTTVVEVKESGDFSDDELEKGHGQVILIADDEPEVLELTATILQGIGYRVLTATNGKEAVEVFEAQKGAVDLLLLDVMMPKLSGPEAAKKIRKTNPNIPIIFCTGYSTNEMHGEMQGIEKLHLMGKTFKFNVLSALVHRVLTR